MAEYFNSSPRIITEGNTIHMISFRKIKQNEILEIINYIAWKLNVNVILYNADEERTIVQNEDVQTILSEFHDAPLGGHVGGKRMRKRIGALFTWPHMRRDIENYCRFFYSQSEPRFAPDPL